MTSTAETAARDPLDLLVEQFLQRRAAEPALTVEEFVAAVPEHAPALRELLPTILALESHKRDRASSGSGRRRAAVPQLERLGEFRIVRELGRGGMGVVFEAVQESLGRKVALKVLPQSALLGGNQLERFRREAQIAAQLHHSNIVPVFGSGESDGFHWYAMQFIAGAGLDRWRTEQQAAPPAGSGQWRSRARFVARLGVQAASALAYAHAQGTLHRDIKPGNLLLEANEHLWVTDFGLAKALEAEGLTHSGDLLGTLQYMAPEQFAGSYDQRSEVYALGVTLYELLTLRHAFAGSSRTELMERIRTQRPESLRRLCPDAPEDLLVIVEKAIARDPGDRYADAAALQRDLQAFLDDRPIAARRLSALGQTWRWCRRNRGMAALAACTALAVLGAGITGWVAYGVTDDALGKAEKSATIASQQSARAEKTLQKTLDAFGEIFDTLIGPDTALAFDEDEETGEQTVVVRTVAAEDVAVLDRMLAFYSQFAAENADNQAARLEAARAYRRVGAIHARLGSPENLDQAAAAYREARERLAALTGRDVRRELAALLVEAGQLDRRRFRPADAAAKFGEALSLLEALPADARGVRLERAEVHFLLAAEPGMRRPARSGGGVPGDRPPDGERERLRAAREHLQRATTLVGEVLASDAGNANARSLQARCLLLSGRLASRSGGPRPEGDRSATRSEALTILRDLVSKHPERASDRFELCRALLQPSSRDDGPRGPREPNPAAVAECREAVEHASVLREKEPQVREYERQRAQASAALGRALQQSAAALPEPERTQRLVEAERELRQGLQLEVAFGGRPEGVDRILIGQTLQTRRALVQVCEQQGRRDDAIEELHALFDAVDALLVDRRNLGIVNEAVQGRSGGPGGPAGGPPGGPEGGARDSLRALVARLAEGRLVERHRTLLQRLPPREEGPPERRGR
jgi:predicted metal-dependent hydrolase